MAAAQLLESSELMREHTGLAGLRMIQLAQDAQRLLAKKTPPVKGTNKGICEYLQTAIQWSTAGRIPSAATIAQLLSIGDMLSKALRPMI